MVIYEEDTNDREMTQFEIDSFPMDFNNVLDKPINTLINSIKEKIKENNKEYTKVAKKDRVEDLKYQKLNKKRHYTTIFN